MDLELKRGFHCLIFACLTERFSTYIKIWLFLPQTDPLFSCWFLFQGGKGNLLLFSKQGKFSYILKKVTKNLVYRLERRLDFLKTVEIITHRALLQILLSGNYNGCCQNQICLTG